MPSSLQRLAVTPLAGPEPVVTCYGDPDDHLRVVVELANALRHDTVDAEALAVCLDSTSPWRSASDRCGRLEAFIALLSSVRPQDRDTIACIVDPDALDVAPQASALWDDASARRERAELLDALVRAGQRGGWVFVRPWPRLSLSLRLDFTDLVGDDGPNHDGAPPGASTLRRWLVEAAGLPRARLEALEEGEEHLGEALTDAALDELCPSALRALVTLSTLRRDFAINGACGPFDWGDAGPESVERDGTKRVHDAGLLLPSQTPGRIRVSRVLRQRLDARMTSTQRSARRLTHAALAHGSGAPSIPSVLERHFHAVQAADLDVALETALYYGSDLREIARDLSFQGRYSEAAAIYRAIVERFDADDAYAWEYLGYNLMRAHEAHDAEILDRIEDAYAAAHRLARTNPLFHGRLIALRLEHRGASLAEADQICGLYRAQAGTLGRDWFGWQVVMALRRSGRRDEGDAFQTAWGITPPVERPRSGRTFGSGRGQMSMSRDFDAPLDHFEGLI